MKKELETALENLESMANSKSELEKEIEKLTKDRELNNISNQKILSEEKCEVCYTFVKSHGPSL